MVVSIETKKSNVNIIKIYFVSPQKRKGNENLKKTYMTLNHHDNNQQFILSN